MAFHLLQVSPEKIRYTDKESVSLDYTNEMNQMYNWMSMGYDTFMAVFPLWKKWIRTVLPHIEGKKILEVSFGSGYLMTQYAKNTLEIYGIDYNEKMLALTAKKMLSKGVEAKLLQANVEKLPFPDNFFDTLINTMAFTGYPNGDKAMSEFQRVLKKNGRLLLVDFDYPANRNRMGYTVVRLWEKMGDVIKNISVLLETYGFQYQDIPVGGFGSVHLFLARKTGP